MKLSNLAALWSERLNVNIYLQDIESLDGIINRNLSLLADFDSFGWIYEWKVWKFWYLKFLPILLELKNIRKLKLRFQDKNFKVCQFKKKLFLYLINLSILYFRFSRFTSLVSKASWPAKPLSWTRRRPSLVKMVTSSFCHFSLLQRGWFS